MKALNDIEIIGGTKTTRRLSNASSNPELGNISVTGLGSDMFVGNYKNKRTDLNKTEATKLAVAVSNYNRAKTALLANPSTMEVKALKKTIANSAITIGTLFDINPDEVITDMNYDLKSFYDE